MPSPIGSFTRGMLTARAENQAKKQAQAQAQAEADKARLAQFNKDRTHNLAVDAEARLVRDDAQAVWDALNAKAKASTGPRMAIDLVKEAAGYDKSFGDVLKTGSLESHIAKMLHMGTGGPQTEGKQGPPSPADVTDSPMAGFTDKLSMLKHKAEVETEETKNSIGEIRADMHKFINETAYEDGMLNPVMLPAALLEYQIRLEENGDYNHELVQKAVDEYAIDAGDIVEKIAGLTDDPEEIKKRKRLLSTSLEKFITGRFKGEVDLQTGITNIFESNDRVTAQKMSNAKARYINMNFDQPAIEILLADQFYDEKAEKWIGGAKGNNRDKALAAGGKPFALAVQKLFEINPQTGQPYVDPLLVKAVYDEESGQGALLWLTPDEKYGQPVNGGPIYQRPSLPFIDPSHGTYSAEPPSQDPEQQEERGYRE